MIRIAIRPAAVIYQGSPRRRAAPFARGVTSVTACRASSPKTGARPPPKGANSPPRSARRAGLFFVLDSFSQPRDRPAMPKGLHAVDVSEPMLMIVCEPWGRRRKYNVYVALKSGAAKTTSIQLFGCRDVAVSFCFGINKVHQTLCDARHFSLTFWSTIATVTCCRLIK
jgi:hypothetical protein